MGMLGALAGAGRGVQGFAQTMRENDKLNWKTQQENIKWERDKSLETLRQKGNRTLAQDKMDFQGKENEKTRTANAQNVQDTNTLALDRMDKANKLTQGNKIVGKLDGIDVSLRELEAMDDAKRKKVMPPEEYEAQQELRRMDAVFDKTRKQSQELRTEAANKFRKIWERDGIDPMEELKLTAMEAGMDIKDLVGTSKPMTGVMLKEINAQLSGSPEYEAAVSKGDLGTMAAMTKDLYSRYTGGGSGQARLSETDIADAKANPEKITKEIIDATPDPVDKQFLKDLVKSKDKVQPTGVMQGPLGNPRASVAGFEAPRESKFGKYVSDIRAKNKAAVDKSTKRN